MADSDLAIFCRQVRKRSEENRRALDLLHCNALMGIVVGILRQELDSMIRCIFLLSVADRRYRGRLLHDSVMGSPWRNENGRGKVTDRDMVDLSNRLHGWTRNVYVFGCGFIHLSALHDYSDRDPFRSMTREDRNDVASYLHRYHGLEMKSSTTFRDIESILPAVFTKIADNLEGYIKDLEADSDLQP